MAKVKVRGTESTQLPSRIERDGMVVAPKKKIWTSGVRAVVQHDIIVEDVADDDLLALEVDGGEIWTRFDDFKRDFPSNTSSRSLKADGIDFEIDPNLGLGGNQRFLGNALIKGLAFFGVDVPKDAAKKFAGNVEAALKLGLRRLDKDAPAQLLETKDGLPDKSKKTLILIHGTGSSTAGSYTALWKDWLASKGTDRDNTFWGKVQGAYGAGNIFAFEHKSLTESPVLNAIDLATALPEGAIVHLVTHSRGGLIGELLARGQLVNPDGPFPEALIKRMFADGDIKRGVARQELTKLNELLTAKKIKVERFVRVACPARGTTLASGRLDRWLSMLTSALFFIPGDVVVKGSVDVLRDLLVAVVKEKANPAVLPGLEAMMPDSPLIRLLNHPLDKTASDLSVVSGDLSAEGFLKSLALGPVGLFYGGAHDLVVNTASMDGGVERAKARIFTDRGPDVTHFKYFTNIKTQRMILEGLLRDDASDAGYTKLVRKEVEIPSRSIRGDEGPRPTVFIIPALFGTHLSASGKRIWLDLKGLSDTGLEALAIGNQEVKAESLIAAIYEPLVTYLTGSHEVIAFPYDWRLSVQIGAQLLADTLTQKLDAAERNRQPVRIVAHGTGGLLTRLMINQSSAVWGRFKKNGGRVLYLGTPMGGTYEPARMLTGDALLTQFLELTGNPEVRGHLAQFPGLLETLPASLLRAEAWDAMRHSVRPSITGLAGAARVRDLIDHTIMDRETESCIAGLPPWATSIPSGIPVFYATALSGDLAKDSTNFAAILDVLRTGSTKLLPAQSTPGTSETDGLETLPRDSVDTFPDEKALAAAAVGGSLLVSKGVPPMSIKVSVAHGNIAFARFPVAAGHYMGDPLAGAEAVLDTKVNSRMSRRYALGLYPGEVGTSAIFLEPRFDTKQQMGAIIVGLGRVGDLKSKLLERTFASGVLEYALKLSELSTQAEQGTICAGLSALLIGTLGGGITPEECVAAILRGVTAANAKLDQQGTSRASVRIQTVELMEIWEDRAIRAARALQNLKSAPDLKALIDVEPEMQSRPGALRGGAPDFQADWWSRIRITAKPEMIGGVPSARTGCIRFDVITNRARTEVELVPAERGALDRFVKRAAAHTAPERQIARTLFEMMIPNRLKEMMPDLGRTVVVLDEQAAQYPWELLENGFAPDMPPLSVQSGFIRQLETQQFRELVIQAQDPQALVVGEPATTYPPLPGARSEATEVARVLTQANFDVTPEINTDSLSILSSLYARPYRILHLAGHGVHRYSVPPVEASAVVEIVSGMVIGDDIFLTAALINQMRRVPELVFINCCYLGQLGGAGDAMSPPTNDRHELAANLAVQFIEMGVKAVIAAGWMVDDAAAKTFSSVFYQFFLTGYTFGQAVMNARQATYEQHQGVNTWGAYQCYGDPGYRLQLDHDGGGESSLGALFVAPEQLAITIDNLAREANVGWKLDSIELRLQSILQAAPLKWLNRADVNYALGRVHGELGDFQKAVECYDKAAHNDKAEGAMKGLEQAENFRVRAAVAAWKLGKVSQPVALQEIDKAIGNLERLLTFGETGERFGLLGSAWKRRALLTKGQQRLESIQEMTRWYKSMADAQQKTGNYSSSLLNWLVSGIVLSWFNPALPHSVETYRQQILDEAASASVRDPDFWSLVLVPDCNLVLYLAIATPPIPPASELDSIADAYKKAKAWAGSKREVQTITDHLAFLVEMAQDRPIGDELRRCLYSILS